jgi:hypothetical protein
LVLLGELGEVVEPLVLPDALPVLLAPALPDVPCSLRHFSFSAPIRLSHLLLPVPAAGEALVPAPMLVPLEVVPVPAPALGVVLLLELVLGVLVVALGALVVSLGLVLVLELVLAEPLTPVPALPVELLGVLVVALGSGALLGLVVVVAEPLTPVLLEAPVPVVPVLPVLLDVPAAGAVLLEVLVLDLLVAPVPLSEAQPAPRATSAAAVAAASNFSFIAFLLTGLTRKLRTPLQQKPCPC